VREVLQQMPARQPGNSRLDTLLYELDAGIRSRTLPKMPTRRAIGCGSSTGVHPGDGPGDCRKTLPLSEKLTGVKWRSSQWG
jgi:hypothetical protein